MRYLDRKGRKDLAPNEVSKVIVEAALKVHTALGAALFEEAYKVCSKHELQQRELAGCPLDRC